MQRTEAVSLVDTENAFNSLNRQSLFNNIKCNCLSLATSLGNCYNIPDYLYFGGKETGSIDTFGIGLAPLLNLLVLSHPKKIPE